MSDTGFFRSPDRDYERDSLRRAHLDADPIRMFQRWLRMARETDVLDAHSTTLATADKSGRPSARIVLLKQADEAGFVFFTNYESRKGRDLSQNPQASMVFYWPQLERQVRVEGRVERVSETDSDEYFAVRPKGSQIAAIVSSQSRVIASRDVLEKKYRQLLVDFESTSPQRPANWGGYRIVPDAIEFWQGRVNRLHDRFRYSRQPGGGWKIERLAP